MCIVRLSSRRRRHILISTKGINYVGTDNELGGCQNDAVSLPANLKPSFNSPTLYRTRLGSS